MGTHLSKVKSISLDTWTLSQVETVRSIGNAQSNLTYNPANYKPAVNDLDDDNIAVEKFIRRKYEQQAFKRPVAPSIPSPVPSKPAVPTPAVPTTNNPFLQLQPSSPPLTTTNPFDRRRHSSSASSSHRPYLDKASIMALYNAPPPPPPPPPT